MQILVDISILYRDQARTGIQRVVRSLWTELNRQVGDDIEIRPVFATRHRPYRYAPPDFLFEKLADNGQEYDQITVNAGDIFLGLDFSPALLPRYETQIREWKRRGLSIHLLVYDLLPLQAPRWFGWKTTRNFRRWLKFLGRHCDTAICISQSVAGMVQEWRNGLRGSDKTRPFVSHIYPGADLGNEETDAPPSHRIQNIFSILGDRRAILMVGTIEPRKAYDKALAAFETLWSSDEDAPCLIIIGKAGWKTNMLQRRLLRHPEASARLFWLQDSDDIELQYLYTHCSGLIFASHAEGYGLPLVEALSHGCPALVRDLPVFREIGMERKSISYFSDDAPARLAETIRQWLNALPAIRSVPEENLPHWRDAGADLIAILQKDTAPDMP